MTPEQQKALALARARRRRQEAQGAAPEAQPAPQQQEQPWYAKAGQAADDVARLIANGATFGYADKLAGYMGGEGTDAERALTEQARERAGSAGTVAEIGGAIATPGLLASKGVTLAGRMGTGAMTGAKGLAARTALMGVEGAGYGALTAAGNDQDIGTGAVFGAAGGAAGNVLGEGISAGVSKVAGAFNKKPAIPSMDEIETLKDAAYQRAEQAGVAYTPQAVGKINTNITSKLTDLGYDPALMPGASVAVKRLQDLQGQNVTLKGLDTIRKIASNGFIPGNKANNAAVSRIVETIDDLIDNAGSGDVLLGNGGAGAAALKEARSLASRAAKVNRVAEAVGKADLRAASTGSGGNADNATRQNLRRILENPRGYSADEKAALDAVVRGTPVQNALRLGGKLSPSGNGLMAALGVGGAMVNPAIGALSLGGMGAKAAADKITRTNVDDLVSIIRAGGNKSATQAAPNAVQRLAESKREALARALMSIGAFEAGTPAR
jgi:hypothetical protein|uniref:Putative HNH endonuclease n=1 Tax=viral metagenome TaxID=1070528 RepID=A0A6H1ZBQ8_9ZZZZ